MKLRGNGQTCAGPDGIELAVHRHHELRWTVGACCLDPLDDFDEGLRIGRVSLLCILAENRDSIGDRSGSELIHLVGQLYLCGRGQALAHPVQQ